MGKKNYESLYHELQSRYIKAMEIEVGNTLTIIDYVGDIVMDGYGGNDRYEYDSLANEEVVLAEIMNDCLIVIWDENDYCIPFTIIDTVTHTKSIIVQLNDEYSAIVTEESVIVGCQEFDHEVIEQLYEATQKFVEVQEET